MFELINKDALKSAGPNNEIIRNDALLGLIKILFHVILRGCV
jgi:hypothetical protein